MTTYVKKSETRDVVWRVFSYFSRGGVIPIDIDEATEGCIEAMSTIEITRCKDCKHYQPLDYSRPYDCSIGLPNVIPTDYCSYGERKEE